MSILLWILAAIALVIAGLALWAGYVARGVERLVPADGRWVEVEGARIHYTDEGEGPAIVMIHGLLGQVRNFADLAQRMRRDHRVIVIDRPGWGWSGRTAPRADIAAQGKIVAALIRKLGLDRPVLVGHSMGGAVSLAAGLAHPELVRGLALIAPYTQPVDSPPLPFKSLEVPAVLRPLIAWTLATPIGMRTGKIKSAQVFSPDAVPADFAIRGGAALTLRPGSFQSGAFEIGMAHGAMSKQAPRYREMKVPVAILYGRGDFLLDPELHGEKTAEAIPGATIQLMDGGHMLQVVYPEATEKWLREAMARW